MARKRLTSGCASAGSSQPGGSGWGCCMKSSRSCADMQWGKRDAPAFLLALNDSPASPSPCLQPPRSAGGMSPTSPPSPYLLPTSPSSPYLVPLSISPRKIVYFPHSLPVTALPETSRSIPLTPTLCSVLPLALSPSLCLITCGTLSSPSPGCFLLAATAAGWSAWLLSPAAPKNS